jgi:beta-glucosidase
VLLKNDRDQLPLNASAVQSIAVIGSHADVGVLSGSGSSQVNPPGGNAVPPAGAAPLVPGAREVVWFRSSPLQAIRGKVPRAKVQYHDGGDPAAAVALAHASQVAILFVNQTAGEGRDLPSLALPDDQDKLVAAVAAANPRTIVVLETGGAVTMPWIDHVNAALEAWYPGIRGAEAIADVLFGDANPSAKLVLSFPRTESDLPHAKPFGPIGASSAPLAGDGSAFNRQLAPFDIPYSEELKVGYKWYDAEGKVPQFEFGHGLSYTTYAYSGMKSTGGKHPAVTFTVKNTGKRAGIEIAQVAV